MIVKVMYTRKSKIKFDNIFLDVFSFIDNGNTIGIGFNDKSKTPKIIEKEVIKKVKIDLDERLVL